MNKILGTLVLFVTIFSFGFFSSEYFSEKWEDKYLELKKIHEKCPSKNSPIVNIIKEFRGHVNKLNNYINKLDKETINLEVVFDKQQKETTSIQKAIEKTCESADAFTGSKYKFQSKFVNLKDQKKGSNTKESIKYYVKYFEMYIEELSGYVQQLEKHQINQ